MSEKFSIHYGYVDIGPKLAEMRARALFELALVNAENTRRHRRRQIRRDIFTAVLVIGAMILWGGL